MCIAGYCVNCCFKVYVITALGEIGAGWITAEGFEDNVTTTSGKTLRKGRGSITFREQIHDDDNKESTTAMTVMTRAEDMLRHHTSAGHW